MIDTMISTCNDQPSAHRSPAASAVASASLATSPATVTSPRPRRARAISTSSRARRCAEMPGTSSASFSAARDSSDRPSSARHCDTVQCRSTSWSGSVDHGHRPAWRPARPRRCPRRGTARPRGGRRVPRRAQWSAGWRSAACRSRSIAVRGACATSVGAESASQRSNVSSNGTGPGPLMPCMQLPGHPVDRRAGRRECAGRVPVPGRPDRLRRCRRRGRRGSAGGGRRAAPCRP